MSTNEMESVLSELGSETPLEEPQAEAEARRRRVLAQMQRVNVGLVRESQKLRWLRWGGGTGLVAGAAAAVAFSVFGPFSAPIDATPGVTVPQASYVPLRTEMTKGGVMRVTKKTKQRLGLGDSFVLEEEHVLETEVDSRARVHGGRGLDIDVGPDSRVAVGAVDPKSGAARIQLQRGLVNCSVDPSGAGPKLSVVTPDATVEVKGTIFSVEVQEDGESSRTCVRVQRGLVTVSRSGKVEQVSSGQASGCDTPEVLPEVEMPEKEEATAQLTRPVPRRKAVVRSGANEPGLPALALQNSLLARALAAERQGSLEEAESQLSELLERFPSTPLRADAESALLRIRKRGSETKP